MAYTVKEPVRARGRAQNSQIIPPPTVTARLIWINYNRLKRIEMIFLLSSTYATRL